MLLFGVGKIFYSDFGLFYQVPLDSGALYDATNVIDTYVYHGLMQLGDIGMASAAGLYQSLVGFILIFGRKPGDPKGEAGERSVLKGKR